MNKQTTNTIVLPNLPKHLHDSSIVYALQNNGIPEEDVAAVVGPIGPQVVLSVLGRPG